MTARRFIGNEKGPSMVEIIDSNTQIESADSKVENSELSEKSASEVGIDRMNRFASFAKDKLSGFFSGSKKVANRIGKGVVRGAGAIIGSDVMARNMVDRGNKALDQFGEGVDKGFNAAFDRIDSGWESARQRSAAAKERFTTGVANLAKRSGDFYKDIRMKLEMGGARSRAFGVLSQIEEINTVLKKYGMRETGLDPNLQRLIKNEI